MPSPHRSPIAAATRTALALGAAATALGLALAGSVEAADATTARMDLGTTSMVPTSSRETDSAARDAITAHAFTADAFTAHADTAVAFTRDEITTEVATTAATIPPVAHLAGRAPRALSGAAAWVWPVAGGRHVVRGYEAPASRYAAGHRGIDITAAEGSPVAAPEAGTVSFAGTVVDRATITVRTADGALISMEPVTSGMHPGDAVAKGSPIGIVSTGGHCSGSCVHLGVRVHGEYVSPMRFFGGVPRAVLLPLR